MITSQARAHFYAIGGGKPRRDGTATDLNDLMMKALTGRLRWDGRRWQGA